MNWTTSKTERYNNGQPVVLVGGRDVFSGMSGFDSREAYDEWNMTTKGYWQFLVYLSDKIICLRAYKQAKQYEVIMNSNMDEETKTRARSQYDNSMEFYYRMLKRVKEYNY